MSARKAELPGPLNHHVTLHTRETRLTLSHDSVVLHKGGIEFRSTSPFPTWAEMTLTLQTRGGKVHCSGVVIACTGNRHSGYHVSMVFTGMSRQAEARLSALASSS